MSHVYLGIGDSSFLWNRMQQWSCSSSPLNPFHFLRLRKMTLFLLLQIYGQEAKQEQDVHIPRAAPSRLIPKHIRASCVPTWIRDTPEGCRISLMENKSCWQNEGLQQTCLSGMLICLNMYHDLPFSSHRECQFSLFTSLVLFLCPLTETTQSYGLYVTFYFRFAIMR